jgi:hypothetical protein
MRLVSRVAPIAALLACALPIGLTPPSSWAREQDDPFDHAVDKIQRPVFKKRDLRAERQQNLRDSVVLAQLVDELRRELETADPNILSASAARKANEIDKLLKRLRSRLR